MNPNSGVETMRRSLCNVFSATPGMYCVKRNFCKDFFEDCCKDLTQISFLGEALCKVVATKFVAIILVFPSISDTGFQLASPPVRHSGGRTV